MASERFGKPRWVCSRLLSMEKFASPGMRESVRVLNFHELSSLLELGYQSMVCLRPFICSLLCFALVEQSANAQAPQAPIAQSIDSIANDVLRRTGVPSA